MPTTMRTRYCQDVSTARELARGWKRALGSGLRHFAWLSSLLYVGCAMSVDTGTDGEGEIVGLRSPL